MNSVATAELNVTIPQLNVVLQCLQRNTEEAVHKAMLEFSRDDEFTDRYIAERVQDMFSEASVKKMVDNILEDLRDDLWGEIQGNIKAELNRVVDKCLSESIGKVMNSGKIRKLIDFTEALESEEK